MIDSHIVLKPKNTVAVFLGPSLTQKQARQILHADYYPPACKGDIYRIMAFGVETIVLIDGLFHNTPSVWQRELVDALEEGIQVLGASSMGALRAAELHNFGMIGYGKVFEWYRDGVHDGDDEVALLHGLPEAEFRPLS
ncbi:TfuA-like protein, partial [Nostoc sp.]